MLFAAHQYINVGNEDFVCDTCTPVVYPNVTPVTIYRLLSFSERDFSNIEATHTT
ncbi:hypothetical protein DPMN_119799 [Dreissena polymorpha]|uniref:Uncharacterized protein n=1 Tax=Dreissena polymorpha TaxID=45954 RepID=A0A9D4GJT4_DREPO|nr:hypothetical protein DPMN_119781 [Dreissena polymorpha]KAH3818200.1 hypothetical protein DPMN_119799 [Dreissena polymorpha]